MTENYQEIVENSYGSQPKYSEIKAGFPEDYSEIKTLGDLLAINYKLPSSKEQLAKNLISQIKSGQTKYPGIIGFDDDVVPALDRAILAGHDIFLIGQIGQAKTKIVQTVAENLLSPIPIVKDSLTNDCPLDLPKSDLISLLNDDALPQLAPIFNVSPETSQIIQEKKLETPIEWKDGADRCKYVLATPDISVKDLVGYIDAVKVAKKGIEMYKIDSYSPGQLMQAKHGIFFIDELPVLDPRKQVALLSVLQEGRFTTGSYPVIFHPKTTFFATANPIDYTHSGKVIEPLYDRLKSHITTHYPKSTADEMKIILQEAKISKTCVIVPILKTLALVAHNLRQSHQINQERGVSVRLGVHGLELLVGEAKRTRSISKNVTPVPRLSDMHCLDQVAKFELSDMDDSLENRRRVFKEVLEETIKKICLELVKDIDPSTLELLKNEFNQKNFQVSQNIIWQNGQTSYLNQLGKFPNLKKLVQTKLEEINSQQNELKKAISTLKINSEPIEWNQSSELEVHSALTEFLLEGLCWLTPKILDKKETGYVSA